MDVKRPAAISAPDLAVLQQAPGRAGITLAVAVLAGVGLRLVTFLAEKSYSLAFIWSLFPVAAIIGFISPRHPIRNATFCTLLIAWAAAIAAPNGYAIDLLTDKLGFVLVAPLDAIIDTLDVLAVMTIPGALVGRTVGRFVRARRVRRRMGAVVCL
jgi:hypothetical protein